MIEIDNVSYRYGFKRPFVLDNFSMHINEPGIYGLLGPNGAGKSTLLYLIMGALQTTNGTVKLMGRDSSKRYAEVLNRVFMVPEEVSLPPIKLGRYTSQLARLYPKFDNELLHDCLTQFGMEADNISLGALSMGQKKKVIISIAIASCTPLLLMDEPTNGLDIQAKAVFRRLIARHIGDERVLVISTHQVRDLESLLDHIMIMSARRVLLDATIFDIQNRLRFARNVDVADAVTALSTLPTASGVDAMFANEDAEADPTEVNLELLFDYTLNHPAEIDKMFNAPKD